MVKPITPDEVSDREIPSVVIEVFNDLIKTRWDNTSAVISLDEALREVAKAMSVPGMVILKEKWLDVEEVYRAAGWEVTYSQGAYNDNEEGSYKFTKRVGVTCNPRTNSTHERDEVHLAIYDKRDQLSKPACGDRTVLSQLTLIPDLVTCEKCKGVTIE